jgi:hypothetical protein
MGIRKTLAAAVIAVSTAHPIAALAGAGTGTVTGVATYASGGAEIFFIQMSALSGTPGCNFTQRFQAKAFCPS